MNAARPSVESQVSRSPASTDWRRQFTRPTGRLGRLIGHVMAVKNRARNDWVVSLLDVRPAGRLLELGFGPGVDVQRVAAAASGGFVAGLDHSEVMVKMARRRNAAAIADGRVDLRLGSMASLPWPDASFDTVYTINAFQFASDPLSHVREMRRVLKPGGLVAIAVQPRHRGATEDTATDVGRRLASLLAEAGFAGVRLERKRLRPVPVVCGLGRR